jgi:hypothetical protein
MRPLTPNEQRDEADDVHRSTCAVCYLMITCLVVGIALIVCRCS